MQQSLLQAEHYCGVTYAEVSYSRKEKFALFTLLDTQFMSLTL